MASEFELEELEELSEELEGIRREGLGLLRGAVRVFMDLSLGFSRGGETSFFVLRSWRFEVVDGEKVTVGLLGGVAFLGVVRFIVFLGVAFLGVVGFFVTADFLTAGDFLIAVGFLAAGFLAVGFLTAGFLAAGFLAAGFLAAGFLAVGFLAAAFFAIGFLVVLVVGFFAVFVADFFADAFVAGSTGWLLGLLAMVR